ncbi:hypothetical protein SDJN03_23748, partial [Cucurbita argyrosperma subsp. sororia]
MGFGGSGGGGDKHQHLLHLNFHFHIHLPHFHHHHHRNKVETPKGCLAILVGQQQERLADAIIDFPIMTIHSPHGMDDISSPHLNPIRRIIKNWAVKWERMQYMSSGL